MTKVINGGRIVRRPNGDYRISLGRGRTLDLTDTDRSAAEIDDASGALAPAADAASRKSTGTLRGTRLLTKMPFRRMKTVAMAADHTSHAQFTLECPGDGMRFFLWNCVGVDIIGVRAFCAVQQVAGSPTSSSGNAVGNGIAITQGGSSYITLAGAAGKDVPTALDFAGSLSVVRTDRPEGLPLHMLRVEIPLSVAIAAAGNVGNGFVTMNGTDAAAPTFTGGMPGGAYRLVITAASSNAGSFTVYKPDGKILGTGTVGSAFDTGGLSFTLKDGATDFAVGDTFTLGYNPNRPGWYDDTLTSGHATENLTSAPYGRILRFRKQAGLFGTVAAAGGFTSTVFAGDIVPFAVQYVPRVRKGRCLGVAGNSIDEGAGATVANFGWAHELQARISTQETPVEICNLANGGDNSSGDALDAEGLLDIFEMTAFYSPAWNVNDVSTTITASIVANMRYFSGRVRAACERRGTRSLTGTGIPTNFAVKPFGATDSLRIAYNAELLAFLGDKCIPFAEAMRGPVDANGQETMLVTADNIHPPTAGFRDYMAPAAEPVVRLALALPAAAS